MKLISCYIENFGGLHHYSLQFSPGLTAVQEPNGFGKTTLAEFIRAMFYGFPRAGKNLDKNIRKKYLPWQGGKYGGNLVFEQEGKQYRIERRFGATPRADTFALYDLETNRLSNRYSENIGLELFQLDSDSYERSTYLPQLHEGMELSTDSIRAKLGNLVEDTNDVNRYDKAIEQLKAKRSTLALYRGTGGEIAQAQQKISELQQQLHDLGTKPGELEGALKEKELLETRQGQTEETLNQLRGEIKKANESARREEHRVRYRQLQQEQGNRQETCDALLRDFPRGVPEEGELEQLAPVLQNALSLERELAESPVPAQEQQFLAENSQRFAGGIPAESQFADCAQQCSDYLKTESACKLAVLQPQEKQSLGQLEDFFESGVPTDAELAELAETERQIGILEGQKRQTGLSEAQQEKMETLRNFFAPGVPTVQELDTQRRNLNRLESLRQEQTRQESVHATPKTEKQSSVPFLCCLAGGILGAAAGTFMMLQKSYAAGGVLLGVGVILLIGAVYLRLKQMLLGQKNAISEYNRVNPELPEQIAVLEQAVRDFLHTYFQDDTPSYEKLSQLSAKAEAYQSLTEQADHGQRMLFELQTQQNALKQDLCVRYGRYFRRGLPENPLEVLRSACTRYEGLCRRRQEIEKNAADLKAHLSELEMQIQSFLRPYFESVKPEQFSELVSQLRRDCDRYADAQKTVENARRRKEEKTAQLERCQDTLQAFAAKYSLAPVETVQQLQSIRDQVRDWKAQKQQLEQLGAEIQNFAKENPEVLLPEETEQTEDPAELEIREQELHDSKNALLQQMTALQQTIRTLRQQAEQIPAKQDELEQWTEKKKTAQKNCDLLDTTVHYLEQAREQLSRRYLGGVQSHFADYLQKLTDEKEEAVFVDTNLEIKVDRCGEARELAYFSAGQSDLIMLCMRLALVDALYEDTSPLIILDDPFVNLDDAHTEKAIELLQKLAQDHQILYLVCNSSRQV